MSAVQQTHAVGSSAAQESGASTVHEPAAYEIDGRIVSRENFYATACDPRRHVAVEACAGAGKTWMLVSRIIRALLDGAQPHEILAITFTRKAAGEMRQRLMQWLQTFARSDDATLRGELLARGVEPGRVDELIAPLRGLHLQMLEQGRSVQIRTFHGWFAALLRAAPLSALEELGLPASYELMENDQEAVSLVWRPFHARLLRDEAARRDYEVEVAVYGRSQTRTALETALARRIEFELADAAGVVEASLAPYRELYPGLRAAYEHLPQEPLELLFVPGPLRDGLMNAARLLGAASQASYSARGSDLERALNAHDSASRYQDVQDALLTQKGEPRKFGDKVAGIDAIRAAQDQLLSLLEAQQQQDAWLHQQRMTRLTRILIEEYAALKRERGWVDMGDLERAALHLLSQSDLSAWVQERLDMRTRHLLIDEFQDTNPMQWQALHAWLSGYAGAGGGASGGAAGMSLFLVGDPKQSIYRFRRAEPQVFRAAQDFVRELGGVLLSCDHTLRNARAVLQLVNGTMLAAQEAGEYADYRAHTTESDQAGEVVALPMIARPKAEKKEAATEWRDSLVEPRVTIEESLRDQECRQAAMHIAAQVAEGMSPGKIMVLARRREPLAVMERHLRALGIPASQPEQTDLGAAPEVQDVVALLDALVSPEHDLSLAQALRSPLLGCDDEALIEVARRKKALTQAAREAGERSPSWLDLLMQTSDWQHPALQDVGVRLQRWQHWINIWPPHDALDAIFSDADAFNRFVAAAPVPLRARVRANLDALLACTLQFDGGRYSTPYALVRALRGGRIAAPPVVMADAVQLLTIHGAKGLEADLVVLLDSDAAPPAARTMSVLLDWPGEAAHPESFIFLPSESKPPKGALAVVAREMQARAREELNALYVALTRARHGLSVSAVEQYRTAASWWRRLGFEVPNPQGLL